MHINEYLHIYLCCIMYCIPVHYGMCIKDNTSSLTAQHFSSLLESALGDTDFFQEKSDVHTV